MKAVVAGGLLKELGSIYVVMVCECGRGRGSEVRGESGEKMAQRGLVSGKEGIWFGKWEEQVE